MCHSESWYIAPMARNFTFAINILDSISFFFLRLFAYDQAVP